MTSCAFCGRENDASSRYCIDCGKPITASAARVGGTKSEGGGGGGGGGSGGAGGGRSGKVTPTKSGGGLGAGIAESQATVSGQPTATAQPSSFSVTVGAAASLAGDVGTIVGTQRPEVQPPVAAPTSCPRCTKPVDSSLPFCGHCGTRVVPAGAGTCANCGAGYLQGVDIFCARCGNRVGVRVSVEIGSGAPPVKHLSGSTASRIAAVAKNDKSSPTQPFLATRRDVQPRLALLDEEGGVAKTFVLERGEAIIGRGDADIRFEADHYMSPLHARVDLRGGQLWLRDLGSRNGTWLFVDGPTRLIDGDLMLVGSQILRFRRLGYPGPHPPEADSTRRMGSLVPSADVAIIEQLRADGSVRDTLHLSPGRSILVGREGGGGGDWLFPYDQTMSGRHAEVRSEDSEFYIHDAGSRNGVAMAVRGERLLKRGQRLLLGNQILRVENA